MPRPRRRPARARTAGTAHQEQVKAALLQSERHRRLALDAAKLGSWVHDFRGRRSWWSPRVRSIFGLGPGGPVDYRQLLRRIHPDDRQRVDEAVRRSFRLGADYDVEYRVVRPGGGVRWVASKGRGFRDAQGRMAQLIGVAYDVTARRNLTEALRLNEQRFRVVLQNSPIIVATVDRKLRYTWIYNSLPGLTVGQMIGKRLDELFPPGDVAEMQALKRAVLRSGKAIRRVIRVRIRGEERFEDVTCEPLRDEAGRIVGVTSAAMNITDRQRTEAQVRSLNETLEQRVAERTAEVQRQAEQLRRLMAELSRVEQRQRRQFAHLFHDQVQQTLAAAKVRLSLVPGYDDNPEARKILREIGQMLDESGDASRLLSAQLVPSVLEDFGLVAALHWLAEKVMERHRLRVRVESDADLTSIGQDLQDFLFQAVRELLFNVAKHADVRQARVTLAGAADGLLSITVSDKGKGFDPAEWRSHKGDRGLGLYSIEQRLAALGGRLDIASRPGRGTRITLRLPPGADGGL